MQEGFTAAETYHSDNAVELHEKKQGIKFSGVGVAITTEWLRTR
jgi:hypothetical protein